ncbi:MAG: hypothetical protein KC609_02165 [Myxococcales bacterium]|nr:hypothetical protein [Myxococcales bacterium]
MMQSLTKHRRIRSAALALGVLLGLALVPRSAAAQDATGDTTAPNQCTTPPVVLVILDESGSMDNEVGSSGKTKWEVAKAALHELWKLYAGGEAGTDPIKVHFGLSVFPSIEINTCDLDMSFDVAPSGKTLLLAPGENTAPNLDSKIPAEPLGPTPLIDTLTWAKNYFTANTFDGQERFVLLITDGKESCRCKDGPPDFCEGTTPTEISYIANKLKEQVAGLKAIGVKTYVVSFATSLEDISPRQLNTIAIEGGTAKAECQNTSVNLDLAQCYFLATDPQSLQDALTTIGNVVTQEICDGKDNDCDGEIDNVPGVGDACTVGEGECKKTGKKVCDLVTGGLKCDVEPGNSTPELCDGLDNNCDGQIDETFANKGKPCVKADPVTKCPIGGVWVCSPDKLGLVCDGNTPLPTSDEVCDGIDNNCDGTIDEGFEGQMINCGQGDCTWTVPACKDGKPGSCDDPQTNPFKEICDGKDNDCDGKIDDFDEDCSSACGQGTRHCTNGQWSECSSAIKPNKEVCDGYDNDCNGKTDDGADCGADAICACGACAKPSVNFECFGEGEFLLGAYCVKDNCPAPLVCNKVTGNCDGDPIIPGQGGDTVTPDADGVTPDADSETQTPDGVDDDGGPSDQTPPNDGTQDDAQVGPDGAILDGSTPQDTTGGSDTIGGADPDGKGKKNCGCRINDGGRLPASVWLLLAMIGLLLVAGRRRRRME